MEPGEQHNLSFLDFQQLVAAKSQFPAISVDPNPFSGQQGMVASAQHYGMVVMGGRAEVELPSMLPPLTVMPPHGLRVFGFHEEVGGGSGQRRWPRQETLTLLEVRARLDSKFREATHKAPLWDEVSRIMAEEHGYHRSGKKCREKIENMYKYYKKTKEGKTGRQDGKHYRFFRQLEALYGGNSNDISDTNMVPNRPGFHATSTSAAHPNPEDRQARSLYESRSLSNSTSADILSTEDDDDDGSEEENDCITPAYLPNEPRREKKGSRSLKRGRRSWNSKMKNFVDAQIRRFMEVQEARLEEMLKTLEHKENERISREEAWRKQEAARLDREHQLWASERAWMEARNTALIEALEKISRGGLRPLLQQGEQTSIEMFEDTDTAMHGDPSSSSRWPESEVIRLTKLRCGMESKFREDGKGEGALWEEISKAMACSGYERSSVRCKEKWEDISKCLRKAGREISGTCPYYDHLQLLCNQGSRGRAEDDGQVPETVGVGLDAGAADVYAQGLQFLIGEG